MRGSTKSELPAGIKRERVEQILLLILVVIAAGCPPDQRVTIPASDSTAPAVRMQVDIPNKPLINATPTSGPATSKVGATDKIKVAASGSDSDGGVSDIQIWVEYTYFDQNSIIGPTLLGNPEASNPDATKQPGETASQSRFVSHQLDIAQIRRNYTGLRIVVWAVAKNFHNGKMETAKVTLEWP